jgi:hypothetical protein
MPRLAETKDGHCIVLHYYKQHSTWQIGGDGVQSLKRRGISLGDMFSTDLFMQLEQLGMVYIGSRPPVQVYQRLKETLPPHDRALHERAQAFYQALYLSNLDDAYKSVLPQLRAGFTLAQFEEKLRRPERWLTSWTIKDCWSVPAQIKDLPEARRIGLVFMDLGGARNKLNEWKDKWYQVQDVWYWAGPVGT